MEIRKAVHSDGQVSFTLFACYMTWICSVRRPRNIDDLELSSSMPNTELLNIFQLSALRAMLGLYNVTNH